MLYMMMCCTPAGGAATPQHGRRKRCPVKVKVALSSFFLLLYFILKSKKHFLSVSGLKIIH